MILEFIKRIFLKINTFFDNITDYNNKRIMKNKLINNWNKKRLKANKISGEL